MNHIIDEEKAKVLRKISLLNNQAKGEQALGNTEAAEAFAAKVNSLLLRYELSISDVEYVANQASDPIVELRVNLDSYGIPRTKVRSEWQQRMAAIIADAHMCKFMIQTGTNNIWFVGTKSHATVAEYAYGTLVPVVDKLSKKAEVDYWKATGCGRGIHNKALGYRSAWIDGFLGRLFQRFRESREAAVNETTNSSTALIRLSGALARAEEFMKARYPKSKPAAALTRDTSHNGAGYRDGRAAADRINLTRGVGSSASRPAIK